MSSEAAFEVRVEGRGPPMVLVPGAACDEAVWSGTIAHYRGRYTLHLLSWAGFAGQRAIKAPLLATARRQLRAYLRDRELDRVVVVGHSLGTFLAYAAAVDDPGRLAAAIAVDGLPALGSLLVPGGDATAIEREALARQARIEGLSRAAFQRHLARSFGAMVREASSAAEIIARAVRSDPPAVARAMGELWTTDLRAELASSAVPVLLIVPQWPQVEEAMRHQLLQRYREQLREVPVHEVAIVEGARHFIMQDGPAELHARMDRFLAAC